MTHDRDMQELTRAIKANTRATEALHSLMLDIERTRRAEKKAVAEDLQVIAKKAVQKVGANFTFCNKCILIECIPGVTMNNWAATGCNCCKQNHDLISEN